MLKRNFRANRSDEKKKFSLGKTYFYKRNFVLENVLNMYSLLTPMSIN